MGDRGPIIGNLICVESVLETFRLGEKSPVLSSLAGRKKVWRMGVSDPIADMLTRIRNANRVRFKNVDVNLSYTNQNVCKVLKRSGYISGYEIKKSSAGYDMLRVYLRYPDMKRTGITDIQRISKPGRRVYVSSEKIPKVLDGYGVAIISTSRGLMTDKEAKALNIGGELLCSVW